MNTVPHAPCGARRKITGLDKMKIEISIRSLRVGRDKQTSHVRNIVFEFQSTRPAWGETAAAAASPASRVYFNPLAPCGARHPRRLCWSCLQHISIHSPSVGRDATLPSALPASINFNPLAPCGARPVSMANIARGTPFQSTRPVWGETDCLFVRVPCCAISIHSPRVGRDADRLILACAVIISIHSPRVGRDVIRGIFR